VHELGNVTASFVVAPGATVAGENWTLSASYRSPIFSIQVPVVAASVIDAVIDSIVTADDVALRASIVA